MWTSKRKTKCKKKLSDFAQSDWTVLSDRKEKSKYSESPCVCISTSSSSSTPSQVCALCCYLALPQHSSVPSLKHATRFFDATQERKRTLLVRRPQRHFICENIRVRNSFWPTQSLCVYARAIVYVSQPDTTHHIAITHNHFHPQKTQFLGYTSNFEFQIYRNSIESNAT